MQLRPYQEESLRALWRFWREKPAGVPLLIAPTGSGKSFIIAKMCELILKKRPKYKIVVVSHRKEIIQQNAAEIDALLGMPVGIYSAGLGQKTVRKVTCANIQSIYKKPIEAHLIVLDECHLIGKKSDSMYQQFLTRAMLQNPNVKLVGLTATPMRMDQGALVGDDTLFTDYCYDISLTELIADGFLSPLISKCGTEKIDLSKVKKSGYDYNQEDLEATMMPHIARHAAEIKARTVDRKHVLVFCSGVKHAHEMAKALGGECVTGEMVAFERDRKLRDFSGGRTKYLCNCEVLTTGYNFPGIDCIVLLRATQSAALYIQAVGRGSRITEGKANCLVLDFGGNIARHGPIDLIQVKRKKDKMQIGFAPTKECPKCGAIVAIRTMLCPSCEFTFPPPAEKLESKPEETAPILNAPEVLNVETFNVKVHRKADKPPSLRLVFSSRLNDVSDFLCFEHGGYATHMAQRKWMFFGGQAPLPKTTEEAFNRSRELITPAKLEIIKAGNFYRVLKILEVKQAAPTFDALEELGINI